MFIFSCVLQNWISGYEQNLVTSGYREFSLRSK